MKNKKNTLAPRTPKSPQFNEHGYTQKAWEAPEGDVVPLCRECLSSEVGEKWAGDEGLTVCDDCGAVEQGYVYIHETEEV